MGVQSHRRQVLLFLTAVLLPCVALVGLGTRLLVQEGELSRARLEDERRRGVALVRQELRAELERIALEQAGIAAARPRVLARDRYADSSVALVARVANGRLVLPWEDPVRASDVRRLLDEGPFGERIGAGERWEFGADDPGRAAAAYRQALGAADGPVQSAHARLFLARALGKAGRAADARAEYLELTADADVTDWQGIPLSLYAGRQLVGGGVADAAVMAPLEAVLASGRWLTPPAVYLLEDLVAEMVDRTVSGSLEPTARRLAAEVARKKGRTEHALTLERDFPGLGLPMSRTARTGAAAAGSTGPQPSGERSLPRLERHPWVVHGEPPWLVSVAPAPEGDAPLIVAVTARTVLASLGPSPVVSGPAGSEIVVSDTLGSSLALGPEFPGLSVRFPPLPSTASAVGSARWWLYGAGLALVLGFTLFGAYLLWRDTRREVALAETRSQFVAAVSHELRTPLTAIRMFAESLRMDRPPDPGARREYLETIVNESERLTRLLNNVLDFSKIDQNRKTYHHQLTALDEVIRRSARAMRYPLEQERFRLQLDVADDLPPLRIDRDAIEQALLNLLDNAMKYSGESREIALRLRSESGTAVIEVADRGVGIEPAEQDRIFERFHRASGAAVDGVSGAGLGLTLVRHIAESHGGRVSVVSAPGIGSTFSLFIPLEGGDHGQDPGRRG